MQVPLGRLSTTRNVYRNQPVSDNYVPWLYVSFVDVCRTIGELNRDTLSFSSCASLEHSASREPLSMWHSRVCKTNMSNIFNIDYKQVCQRWRILHHRKTMVYSSLWSSLWNRLRCINRVKIFDNMPPGAPHSSQTIYKMCSNCWLKMSGCRADLSIRYRIIYQLLSTVYHNYPHIVIYVLCTVVVCPVTGYSIFHIWSLTVFQLCGIF